MQRKVTFTIPGDPVPQGRPRFSTHGGFARAYDPKKSRDGKSVVKFYVQRKRLKWLASMNR